MDSKTKNIIKKIWNVKYKYFIEKNKKNKYKKIFDFEVSRSEFILKKIMVNFYDQLNAIKNKEEREKWNNKHKNKIEWILKKYNELNKDNFKNGDEKQAIVLFFKKNDLEVNFMKLDINFEIIFINIRTVKKIEKENHLLEIIEDIENKEKIKVFYYFKDIPELKGKRNV